MEPKPVAEWKLESVEWLCSPLLGEHVRYGKPYGFYCPKLMFDDKINLGLI